MTNKLTPETRLIDLPSFGAELPGEGGYFAGIAPTSDGGICALILASEACPHATWNDAMAWAAALEIDGHRDFVLPTRTEQSLLFATVGDFFANDWNWSATEHVTDKNYAWVCAFGDGIQDGYLKGCLFHARAIRRLTIR